MFAADCHKERERMPDRVVWEGRRGRMVILVLLAVSALAGHRATQAQAPATEVSLTEEQREFLDEGPGWLWSEDERTAFHALDAAGRDAKMAAFLAQDPIPET